MKVLTIIGSPRSGGNTFKAVRRIEESMVRLNKDLVFEYVELSKEKLQGCIGCYVCLLHGEDKCPLKDGRAELEQKMYDADAIIFASPVYTYNVSWVMKNFFDRFAYRCHRPDFIGKKAMVVTTTGAVGLWFVNHLMAFMVSNMGFTVIAKIGLTYDPVYEIDAFKASKEDRQLQSSVRRFVDAITTTKADKPSFMRKMVFGFQKKAFSNAPKDSADYLFWKEKGWLEKDTRYYK